MLRNRLAIILGAIVTGIARTKKHREIGLIGVKARR
jgi:hypothetical protein